MGFKELDAKLSPRLKLMLLCVAAVAALWSPVTWAQSKLSQVDNNTIEIVDLKALATATAQLTAELKKKGDSAEAASRARLQQTYELCKLGVADPESEQCKLAVLRTVITP